MTTRFLLSFLILALITTAGAADVTQVKFGEFVTKANDGDTVRETPVMSLTEKLAYGWMATTTATGKITYHETLTIPAKGYNFRGEPVVAAKTVIITTKEIAVVAGQFGHKWRPSADDPGGEYHITVTVDGKVVLEKKFSLLPP